MASLVATEEPPTKWPKHIWSAQAVRDAVIKSPKTVTLTSITNEVVVTVHQELLCFFSLYYNAALNGNFLEAKKDCFEVALSGDRLMSFMTWLYTGEISTDKRPVPCLLELYVFADQADILALRREALRRLSKSKSFMPGYNSVMLVLQNVMPESQLYKWVLDAYITHWGPQSDVQDPCPLDSDTDSDHLMAKFVYQAMNGIAIRKMKDQPGCSCCNDVCQYHEHSSKQEWEATCGKHQGTKMPASLTSSSTWSKSQAMDTANRLEDFEPVELFKCSRSR